jgi:peroxiredoxin
VTAAESPGAAGAAFTGLFGDYELLEEIARGGMGVVYRARQKSLNRVVALKLILAGRLATRDQVRRFRIEAEEAGKLDHPNIVPIHHVGEEQGHHYFTMKLIEGGSLTSQVRRFATDPAAACRLVSTVARAVHYAHQRGTLHRDLKPGNILLDADGEPHVTDFGLAKHLGGGGAGTATGDTQSGVILGTPNYMAPEQAAAKKDLSVAVDVYSLGVILYELLTGKTPFHGDSMLDTIMQVMDKEPPPPRTINPKIDRDLETICLNCLNKEPARRYRSAARLADDLDHYLAGEPIEARPIGTLERTVKWVRRRPAAAALIAVCALAAVGLSVLGWHDSFRLDAAWRAAEANAADAQRERDEAQRQRDEVGRQRDEIQRQRDEVERQRDQASASFRKRQDTVDALFVRIDRRLENSNVGPETRSVRLEFLNEFLKLNDDLLRERGQEPEVRRQAAQLHQRIGDVTSLADGERHYRKAIALYEGLIDQGPANLEDRVQLANSYAQLALLQRQYARELTQRRKELYAAARESYEEAIRQRGRLAADTNNSPGHRFHAAAHRFLLADLFEEQRQPKEAEALYRKALAEQEQLVKEHAGEATYSRALLDTAGSLALLLEATKPDEAQQLLERIAHAHWEELKSNPRALDRVINSGYDLAAHLQHRGKHADMARLAADITREFSTSFELHYHAACYVARAVPALDVDRSLSSVERQQLAGKYCRQAVELLRRAVQVGWKDREHMFLDADMDPLRPRAEFRELIADLDKRIGKPLTTDQLIRYLSDRYRQEQFHYQNALATARTVAERKKAGANRPKPEDFVRRLLTLAEEHPKEPAAVAALGQVLVITSSAAQPRWPAARGQRAEAFQILERDHMKAAALADIFVNLAKTPTADGDQLLRAALDKHTLPEVRGQAGFWLARSLAAQAKTPMGAPTKATATLFAKAEELFEQVARDYDSLPHGGTTLGEAARTQLHALRHLTVGRPAVEIAGPDLDGKPMRLSDFRGKVVLLDFWANWCGFCRQMYPYEKALIQRLRSRPFVLVGVNNDNDKAELQREIKRHQITWRSWWDSDGRITTRWQSESLPSIFLIDHNGIIRERFSGVAPSEVIDAAVERLLKECEQVAQR